MASYILTQKKKEYQAESTDCHIFYYYQIGDFGSIEAVSKGTQESGRWWDRIDRFCGWTALAGLKEGEFELLSNYLADDEPSRWSTGPLRYSGQKEANDAVLKEVGKQQVLTIGIYVSEGS